MTVKEAIIEKLTEGIQDKAKLIELISQERKVTIQAVYKSLNKLARQESIVLKDGRVSFTLWHIEEQALTWNATFDRYRNKVVVEDFLKLSRGQKMTVTFKNLQTLDAYWTQSFLILERVLPVLLPTYSIVPHDWFYYARPKSDRFWTKSQDREQRLVISHPFLVDWQVVKERRKLKYKITPDVNPFKTTSSHYFTLISDWIFEVEFDQLVNDKLEKFIKEQNKVKDIDQEELQHILSLPGKFTLCISHDPKKASKFVKKVSKYFE